MGLAVVFFCVTCYVLFEDVIRHGALITTDHIMTMAVLVGTIASGHMVWAQAREWRVFPAIGLALLFCVGTIYCVTASAGRNALATIEKGLGAHDLNDKRARLKADIDDAKNRRDEAIKSEDAECASGEGPRCTAKRKTRKERENNVYMLEAELRLMAPEQPENADIKHAAKVFAQLPWVTSTPQQIEELLVLFLPFFKASFSEVATIVFASIGLGHRRQPSRVSNPATVSAPETVAGRRTVARKPGKRSAGDEQAVRAALAKAGGKASNAELARLMGVSEGEASKRVGRLNGSVRKTRVGREVQITLQ
jgi:hypothetical protein